MWTATVQNPIGGKEYPKMVKVEKIETTGNPTWRING